MESFAHFRETQLVASGHFARKCAAYAVPDATALGQIYWYTLEGRDPKTGKPAGGWNAEELRTIQDFYVKYSLSAAEGVSEVASAGGFIKEYQIELNPDAMYSFNVSVMDVMNAVKKSNLDIGAETMEVNKVEYLIRGLGYVKNVADIENTVVTVREGVPVRISDIAFVNIGRGRDVAVWTRKE